MAIQNRRGNYSDFDPNKLAPGEWAVVQSGDPNSSRGKSVYMAFNNGDVERMATYEDIQENIDNATTDVQEQFASEMIQATTAASNAASSATTAAESATAAAAAANEVVEDIREIVDEGGLVATFNGRSGFVVPESGDYTASQITHGEGTVASTLESMGDILNSVRYDDENVPKIPNGADLNSYSTPGTYIGTINGNYQNVPPSSLGFIYSATPFRLEIKSLGSGYTQQTISQHDTRGFSRTGFLSDENYFWRPWNIDIISTTYRTPIIRAALSNAVSVPSGTATELLQLPASTSGGYWFVVGLCVFPTNATGYRAIQISGSSHLTTITYAYPLVRVPAVSDSTTVIQVTAISDLTATLRLIAQQNSGSALSITSAYLVAFPIPIY